MLLNICLINLKKKYQENKNNENILSQKFIYLKN